MVNFQLIKKKSFGIDLGNNNTIVSDHEKILVDQPSYIVLDKSQQGVRAVGNAAFEMFEKSHQHLKPVKPLKGGVIADQTSATKMISALMHLAYGNRSLLQGYDKLISGVPYATSNVEKRALKTALEQFNANRTYLLYEPLAAALGMGLDISQPDGKMIVDIGGGITEIVIISLSGIAAFQSVKVAGDTMDEEIRHYFRRKYNMEIGLRTAEQVKITVGAVQDIPLNIPAPLMVKGKDLMRGIPTTRSIDHTEVASILEKSVGTIELGILQALEKCPPELAGDIYNNGIFLTGGNALLRGLRERLQTKLMVKVHVDKTALHSVSKGVASVLRDPGKYRTVLMEQ
jgi:rod shape-determining protein MreB and related proteins